jgi:hypothetical protein
VSPLKIIPLVLLIGCSHADWGQLSDSATTAVALNSGFSEGNPLLSNASWLVIAGVKVALTQVVKLTPPEICEPGLTGLAGSGPAALPLAVGLAMWQGPVWFADSQIVCAQPYQWRLPLSPVGWSS